MYPWLTTSFLQLNARISAKKLHHALLIQGPTGLGKTHFTHCLAKQLLCANPQQDTHCGHCQACQLNAAGTHPDLHIIESEKQIGVDQIREAIKKLTGSAHLSGAKVLIIHQADSMTESSANALLKTLEEPTAGTYLLLITAKSERILPTIKSRCEKLNLPVPDLDTTLNWVKTQFSGPIDIHFARLFAARPLALLEELQQEQSFTFDTFNQGLTDLLSGQQQGMTLAISWQQHIEKVLKWTQFWLKQQLVEQSNTLSVERLFAVNNQTVKISQQIINPGVNKLLLLTSLLDAVSALSIKNSIN